MSPAQQYASEYTFDPASSAYSHVPPTPLRTIPSFINLQTYDVSTDVTPDGDSPISGPQKGHGPGPPLPSLKAAPSNGHVIGLRASLSRAKGKEDEDDSYLAPRVRRRRKDPVERAKYDAEGM